MVKKETGRDTLDVHRAYNELIVFYGGSNANRRADVCCSTWFMVSRTITGDSYQFVGKPFCVEMLICRFVRITNVSEKNLNLW